MRERFWCGISGMPGEPVVVEESEGVIWHFVDLFF